ncbi:MAG: sigma 54-interacting transcriptional regulator [Candidatus Methylomirabilales bacterium]
MTDPAAGPAAVPSDLLASLTAIGHSMQEEFDPASFLDRLSSHIRPMIPHDRLVIDYLHAEGRTFTVFAEHALPGLRLHRNHYTTDFDPETRYVADEWVLRRVFAGERMLVHDFPADPRFAGANAFERRVQEAGIRSGMLVPLSSGGRIIGALVATALEANRYAEAQLAVFHQLGNLIAPFIENLVLLHSERHRRRRLKALDGLTRALGASLNVRDVFARLAEAVRPVLDFDVMGVVLLSASGREVEMLAEVDNAPMAEMPGRIPLEDFSCSEVLLRGETLLVHDAPRELDPQYAGDRLIIEGGGRSSLMTPLMFGERAGGALYFGKRRPFWFDRMDVEVATAIAAQVVLALQHQRMAEEQRRLATIEGRARRLERRVESLEDALEERYGFDRIIGRSAGLREALERAGKVAPLETTVLITGESGTGKELVARAIHRASRRAEGPFVAINCAALPDTLLESELFGHERGAFTGADRQKPGRFEVAAGGTLFLDEVAELSPGVQAKLLRVLQEREFQRLGGNQTLRADVRLIAATNRDLAQQVSAGRFREDLFYRLNVFTVHLPPLRERGDDVLLLADHFVRTLGARMAKGELGLSRDAREALLGHAWPGNIRELQNAVERSLIVSEGGLISAAHLALPARTPPQSALPGSQGLPPPAAGELLSDVERRLVMDALDRSKGNKSKAAALLGITRSQLYTRLKRFGLDA